MSTPNPSPDPDLTPRRTIHEAAAEAQKRLPKSTAVRVQYDVLANGGFAGGFKIGYQNFPPVTSTQVGAMNWPDFERKMIDVADDLADDLET